MSFDQTGVQACLAPWVIRPLPAKKSSKIGREVFRGSFEQFLCRASILECSQGEWGESLEIQGGKQFSLGFPRQPSGP